ncbi:NAD(P)H-dependent oxidoreductase [Devosia rhodophyticola]|uniref:NAD(P)H-dependent oxidoreductase n=1 Tax=Devosia rhodophyticola TaxID=3026423 RepID=A0ABY7YT25_9HYPH|nr:NADPH-dependent FMN reductase [Devosia rhodophyticola]WDR04493.1 NAD(P)H-dependent oxidoreductase [Devosia rhodophyticola]
MKFSIFSCSLDPASRSLLIAREVEALLAGKGHVSTFIDLRTTGLPPFDNTSCFNHPEYALAHRAIEESHGVFIASPIYNWSLESAAANLIELTGATGNGGRRAAWFDKIVTFLCADGLPHSYMAYGPVALSLMLDFKCVINPYTVYATDQDFDAETSFSTKLRSRINKTVEVKIELANGLSNRVYRSGWEV